MDLRELSSYKDTSVPIDEPLFLATPTEVTFQNFVPLNEYEVAVVLRNVDTVPRRVKVLPSHSPYVFPTTRACSPHALPRTRTLAQAFICLTHTSLHNAFRNSGGRVCPHVRLSSVSTTNRSIAHLLRLSYRAATDIIRAHDNTLDNAHQHRYFEVIAPDGAGVKVAAGMELVYKIIFRPDEARDYADELVREPQLGHDNFPCHV
jgi:hypothetical protein